MHEGGIPETVPIEINEMTIDTEKGFAIAHVTLKNRKSPVRLEVQVVSIPNGIRTIEPREILPPLMCVKPRIEGDPRIQDHAKRIAIIVGKIEIEKKINRAIEIATETVRGKRIGAGIAKRNASEIESESENGIGTRNERRIAQGTGNESGGKIDPGVVSAPREGEPGGSKFNVHCKCDLEQFNFIFFQDTCVSA
jgi:hypothetical protein